MKSLAIAVNVLCLFTLFTLTCTKSLEARVDSSGPTVIDATDCASPSCTVTPTTLSPITVTPDPVTIPHAPGAITPVVLTFDPITISNLKPKPTVLANNGNDPLTLGSTTISNLKATATTSYLVVPSDADNKRVTLDVAVEVDVREKAQLFFGFNNDDDGVCKLFPSERRQDSLFKRLFHSRSLRRGLGKRVHRIIDTNGEGDDAWINDAIGQATTVLQAVQHRFIQISEEGTAFSKVKDSG
jgi:hypothetical protein